MKLMRFWLGIFLLLAWALPFAASADGGEQAFIEAKSAYRKLENSSRGKMYRDNWLRVIRQLEKVSQTWPSHARAADALYLAGKAGESLYAISRNRGDAQMAVQNYDRLADRYPASSLADDACYLAGLMLERSLGEPSEAYRRYRRVLDKYPDGDMHALCRQGAFRLRAYAGSASEGGDTRSATEKGLVLNRIRHWASPDYTRVVIELTRPAQYTTHLLKKDLNTGEPPRLYVDVKGASLARSVPASQKIGDGLLQSIRVGKPGSRVVRVVLDLETYKDYKIFTLENPQRIVIDVSGERPATLEAATPSLHAPMAGSGDAIAKVLEKTPAEKPLKVVVPTAAKPGGLRRIVVDAGHGGKDPGAIGPSGVMEKDVTLALAKRLAVRLEKELGCQVVLTRDKDVFLPLEERTAIANRVGADLFISIHANASNNRSAQGVETYYLNFSKNDKAAAVAARENGTSLKEVSDLELILFDLMANAKINESSRLAAEIQKSLVDRLGRHYADVKNHGVRQGPFYVLLGANMPSVLVETAFISNKTEEKRLKSSKYQDHAATAIAQAVNKFSQLAKTVATK